MERSRIAREMHDDRIQRLAILAIDAAKLEAKLDPSSNAHRRLQEMRGELTALSEVIHLSDRRPERIARGGLFLEVIRLADRLGVASKRRGRSVPNRNP
jgi:signal transduction histidine kinase